MRWQLVVGLFVVLLVYVVVGGLIFWYLEIEERREMQQRPLTSPFEHAFTVESVRKELTSLVQQLNSESEQGGLSEVCLTNDDFLNVIRNWTEMKITKEIEQHRDRWTWAGSIFFASTVVTTIGYGNMVPYSTDARIFCCLYAIFGIPLCLCALVVIGDRLSAMTSWIQRRIRCRSTTAATGPGAKRCESICRAVVPASLGLLVFILLPSVVFMVVQDWDYATALYFSVISLSTIGFGDYVAGVDCQCGEVYRLLVAVWIFVGLAWLAGVIGRVQKRLQSVATTIESRLLPPLSSNADHQGSSAEKTGEDPPLNAVPDDADAAVSPASMMSTRVDAADDSDDNIGLQVSQL